MPGLVGDAMPILTAIAHPEAKFGRPEPEPSELGGGGKTLGQVRLARRPDIDGPAGVMLAVSGSGDPAKDILPILLPEASLARMIPA